MKAYAKINLTLDVFGKRPDGYHEIASIFQTVSLADDVEVDLTGEPGIEIAVDGPMSIGVPTDCGNLAARAAAELLATVAPDTGASIRLTKRIPAQAGLGGGSSDAAAVLKVISAQIGIDARSTMVCEVARRIGADVLFFLTGGTAKVTGLGEIVEPLPDIEELQLVIARPGIGVSTAAAYEALDATSNRVAGDSTARWPHAGFGNDFEAVVYSGYPAVAAVRDALIAAGCSSATLCGSGSAVFGVAGNTSAVQDALLAAGVAQAWAVETVGVDSSER